MSQLLNEFKDFFNAYQAIWNRCDTKGICEICSTDLHVRWAYPGNTVSDSDTRKLATVGDKLSVLMLDVIRNGHSMQLR